MGKLAVSGVHAQGTPFGVWCDAMWAMWVDYLLLADQDRAGLIEELWDEMTAPPVVAPPRRRARKDGDDKGAGHAVPPWRAEGRRPTPEEIKAWSGTAAAQRGQAALLEMAGRDPNAAWDHGDDSTTDSGE